MPTNKFSHFASHATDRLHAGSPDSFDRISFNLPSNFKRPILQFSRDGTEGAMVEKHQVGIQFPEGSRGSAEF